MVGSGYIFGVDVVLGVYYFRWIVFLDVLGFFFFFGVVLLL